MGVVDELFVCTSYEKRIKEMSISRLEAPINDLKLWSKTTFITNFYDKLQ